MKNQFTLILAGFFSCFYLQTFSQATVSGGAGHSAGAGPPVLFWNGWDAATTIPFNLEHRGAADINFKNGPFLTSTNRLVIRGTGAGAFAGFVGIGANFLTPQNLLHIHDGSNSYLQVTNATTGNLGVDGVKFGLFGNTNNAIVAQQENANLYFATNGSALGQVRMTVLPNGNVGIGNGLAFISSINNKLDVDQGDIDVNTAQRSYMIADQSVLWHKGSNENIFVGVGAIV